MSKNKKGIRVAVVVEDQMLERFLRSSLLLLGYHKREIRVEKAPAGDGSGKKWVDNRSVIEVKALRSKNFQKGKAVLVAVSYTHLTLPTKA